MRAYHGNGGGHVPPVPPLDPLYTRTPMTGNRRGFAKRQNMMGGTTYRSVGTWVSSRVHWSITSLSLAEPHTASQSATRVIDQWSATRSSRTPIPRKREGRIIAPLYKLIVHISSYSGPKTFLPSCLPGVAVAAQSRRPKTRNIGQNYE